MIRLNSNDLGHRMFLELIFNVYVKLFLKK